MDTNKIFLLFVYKQFKVLLFHWKTVLLTFVACFGLQYFLLYFAYVPIQPLTVFYSPESPETLRNGCYFNTDVGHSQTFYAPNSAEANAFIEQKCGVDMNIKSFSHPETMVKAIEECKENCVGVYFKFASEADAKQRIQYEIYTNRIKLPTDQRYVTDSLDSSYSQSRDFLSFITLQHSINMEYITQITNIVPDISVDIGSMPFMRGGYFSNEPGILFALLFPIFFIMLLETTFLIPLVEEKQDGLKEFLVIASPLSYLNGVAFYVVRLILYIAYALAVLIVAAYFNVFGIVPAIYVFVLVLLFILAIMSYAYLVSVCFNEVFYAKICGSLLLVLPAGLSIISSSLYKVGVCLFSLNAFIDAWYSFQKFGNKIPIFEFSNLFDHVTDNSFSIFQICLILLIQCICYTLLYAYLCNIFPGPGGIRKSYLYFLRSEYWRKPKNCNEHVVNECYSDAIIVQDLEKQFKTSGRNILIADRLNMVIKNREITVLLGHNGAGKTTTINMIMGLIPKDNGKISVCSESDAICYRHLIGYCPQHSIYMQYMTCKQHLVFFAKLRGLSDSSANALAHNLLKQLNLYDKANEYGKNLSGGMRRRLSLGIALAGETKVVVLDEPSSGLDIESRRELWNILLELRKTKAILITTHHMEEAEVLGDTICILSNGRLQLTGSPLELKRKVGSGYILKLCTNPNHFNEDECLELIRTGIPSAIIMNIIPPTVLISLPYEYRENYSQVLANLEKHQQQLGITTISVTDTTLEDVFLNSAPKVDEVDGGVIRIEANEHVPYQRLDSLKNVNVFQQFSAIAYKKLLFLKNEWILALFMILLPFLITTIAILCIQSSTITKFGSGLHLTLRHYKQGIIYLHTPSEPSPDVKNFHDLLKREIQSHPEFITKPLILNGSNSIEDELVEIMKMDYFDFQQNVIGCLDLSSGSVSILYSPNAMHSSAILTNLVDNAIYMAASNSNDHLIDTIYSPVSVRNDSPAALQLGYYAIMVPFGIFMLMFYFAMLPFKENRSGFKNLQAISSVIYWFSVLICDLLLLLLICLLLYGYQVLIMPSILYNTKELCSIICAIFFYGLTYLPLIYCLTNTVGTLSALSSCMVILFYISYIPTQVLSTSIAAMLKYESYILFLRLLPDFNLSHQLRVINERFVNNRQNVKQSIIEELNSKNILSLSTFYFYAALMFPFLMFIFLYIVENKQRRHFFANFGRNSKNCKTKSQPLELHSEDDRLVQEEKSTVEKIVKDNGENEFPLIVQNIYKCYTNKRPPAVCGLNFLVRKKECFGLLGVNGAGKTSTFEMIAANQIISLGTIKIDGVDIIQNESEYKYRFGYCPQNDCLNGFMTAYQTLRYMALLRGIQMQHVHDEVSYWLEKLDLLHYKNVQVRHYSGGTKRKLQTAAAMIGSPSLVLLDEPTTGVDPISRRFLWKSMQDFQLRDKTIVLTSHSMDECEHLCNRLAIMAEGQFKCLGYVPELKQLYGQGFTISVKLKTQHANSCVVESDESLQYITENLQKEFPDCTLRENHSGISTYFIKIDDIVLWSEVFKKCEEFLWQSREIVEEYSVNETTLEDIFLKYDTKNQRKLSGAALSAATSPSSTTSSSSSSPATAVAAASSMNHARRPNGNCTMAHIEDV